MHDLNRTWSRTYYMARLPLSRLPSLTGLVVLGQSLGLAGWLAIAAIVTADVVSLGRAGRRAVPASAWAHVCRGGVRHRAGLARAAGL